MKSVKPKVVKITHGYRDDEQTVFSRGNISESLKHKYTFYSRNPDQKMIDEAADQEIEETLKVFVKFGKKTFERDEKVFFKGKNRKYQKFWLKKKYKETAWNEILLTIDKKEYEDQVREIVEKIEKKFYLSESELLNAAEELIPGKIEYKHFSRQVEIDKSIVDGLAIIGNPDDFRIIAFEVKTNIDNYSRLYSQLNSYLSLVDEVYLVLQSKKIPKDLPFFVGVMKVENGKMEIMRRATSLKHSIDHNEVWSTLMRSAARHVGLEDHGFMHHFFKDVENIKRKLVWNQFVIGFHRHYYSKYIKFTDQEKRLINTYNYMQKKQNSLDKFFQEDTNDNK